MVFNSNVLLAPGHFLITRIHFIFSIAERQAGDLQIFKFFGMTRQESKLKPTDCEWDAIPTTPPCGRLPPRAFELNTCNANKKCALKHDNLQEFSITDCKFEAKCTAPVAKATLCQEGLNKICV